MTMLSPSLVRLDAPLAESLRLADRLGCESVHVDVCCDPTMPHLFGLEETRTAQIASLHARATVHVFQPSEGAMPTFDFLRPCDLALLHVFPQTAATTIRRFLDAHAVVGCRVGLAVDIHGEIASVAPYVGDLDTVFVMAIPAGGSCLDPDGRLTERVAQLRGLIADRNHPCRLGIDGGVNGRTFRELVRLSDELVVGSLLFNADDLVAQWNSLQTIAREERNT